MDTRAKFDTFAQLHSRPGAFVMPNPWNAGTARILTALGFEALATTSAGFAFSIGRRDSSGSFSRDEVLQNAREIVEATVLPVSGDLEDGFGRTPEVCAQTIREAISIGLVGGSIEDCTGDSASPIFSFDEAVDRVGAACEAAAGHPFLVTARAEGCLYGHGDLSEIVRRLQAFENAGADVVYAPGLPSLEAIRIVCAETTVPVNVVMGLQGATYTVDQLAEVGVKRISVGGSFARAALGALVRAASEVQDHGTFSYATDAIPDAKASAWMSQR
jgi:2-methylisocitrate lyase-like PEP mutase family enzyme